jgi:anti-sigma factor RsiW
MVRRDRDAHGCARALVLIDEHLDGRLSDAAKAELAAHIRECGSCLAELKLATTIHHELAALPRFDTPPHIVAAARRTVGTRADKASLPAWFGRSRPIFAAAAAAAVIGVAITVLLMTSLHLHQAPARPDPEVARATAEARLAFALIADATRRAEHELREGVMRDRVLARAVRGVSRSFGLVSSPAQIQLVPPTPTSHPGGST